MKRHRKNKERSLLQPLYDLALSQVVAHLVLNTNSVVYEGTETPRVTVTHEMHATVLLEQALVKALTLPVPVDVIISFANVTSFSKREQTAITHAATAALRIERRNAVATLFLKIGVRKDVASEFTDNVFSCRSCITELINLVDDVAIANHEEQWDEFIKPPDR